MDIYKFGAECAEDAIRAGIFVRADGAGPLDPAEVDPAKGDWEALTDELGRAPTVSEMRTMERGYRARLQAETVNRYSNRCERCAKQLNADGTGTVWLELNSRTNRFEREGTVPPEDSQGFFPFGADCAAVVIKNGGRK